MKQKIGKIITSKPTMLMYDIQGYSAPHTIFTKNKDEKRGLINFLQREMEMKSVVIKISTAQSNNEDFSLKLIDQEQIFYATFFLQGDQACGIEVLNDIDVIIIDVAESMTGDMFDELLEIIRIQLGIPYLYGAKKFAFIIDKSSPWGPACSTTKSLFESYYYMDFRPFEYQLTEETAMDVATTNLLHRCIGNPSLDLKEEIRKLLEQFASLEE